MIVATIIVATIIVAAIVDGGFYLLNPPFSTITQPPLIVKGVVLHSRIRVLTFVDGFDPLL
jgi:hypothetical protein